MDLNPSAVLESDFLQPHRMAVIKHWKNHEEHLQLREGWIWWTGIFLNLLNWMFDVHLSFLQAWSKPPRTDQPMECCLGEDFIQLGWASPVSLDFDCPTCTSRPWLQLKPFKSANCPRERVTQCHENKQAKSLLLVWMLAVSPPAYEGRNDQPSSFLCLTFRQIYHFFVPLFLKNFFKNPVMLV